MSVTDSVPRMKKASTLPDIIPIMSKVIPPIVMHKIVIIPVAIFCIYICRTHACAASVLPKSIFGRAKKEIAYIWLNSIASGYVGKSMV